MLLLSIHHWITLILSLPLSLLFFFLRQKISHTFLSWIAQQQMSYDFSPSHIGWKRQRCKMCAKLLPNSYKAWHETVQPMGCYACPPIVWGCQLANSYSLQLYWTQFSHLTDMFLPSESPFSALHPLMQGSCILPPKTDDYCFGYGQSTLWLWTKGWIYSPKSANVTQVYAKCLTDSKQRETDSYEIQF